MYLLSRVWKNFFYYGKYLFDLSLSLSLSLFLSLSLSLSLSLELIMFEV